MREENTGSLPLRVLAEPRLLAFEISPADVPNDDDDPPARVHPVRCELPADMRPDDDDDRVLSVPPGAPTRPSSTRVSSASARARRRRSERGPR